MNKPSNGLEMLAFDVLCDLIPPANVSVDETNRRVTVRKCPRTLMGMLHEEWRHATVGSEFADVKLTIEPGA